MSDRAVLSITGNDRLEFLQGLLTNDVTKPGLIYAALLSPQGKYLVDFFVLARDGAFLIDVSAGLSADLIKRLSMYRLRADVQISQTEINVTRGTGAAPEGAYADPRHAELGWRSYDGAEPGKADWDALRVAHLIPETGIELIPNETYILEVGFEALNGVDFRKGCYVGQEVTARMKHKTELRKGLARVVLTGKTKEGEVQAGDEITAQDKPIGVLHTISGDKALAYLRFDRATGTMQAGDAELRLDTK